jgi:HEAT repeat protein
MSILTLRPIQTLRAQDAEIRSLAAQALGAIGSAAKPALIALPELQSDTDEDVRHAAMNEIQSISKRS